MGRLGEKRITSNSFNKDRFIKELAKAIDYSIEYYCEPGQKVARNFWLHSGSARGIARLMTDYQILEEPVKKENSQYDIVVDFYDGFISDTLEQVSEALVKHGFNLHKIQELEKEGSSKSYYRIVKNEE